MQLLSPAARKKSARQLLLADVEADLWGHSDGAPVLTLTASPAVLSVLGIAGEVPLTAGMNCEAILGLVAELSVAEGVLFGTAGQTISPRSCVGMLGRLGFRPSQAGSVLNCLALCVELGLMGEKETRLIDRIYSRVRGPVGRLNHCIDVLEQRGYRLRLSGRLTAVCHPVPEVPTVSNHLFQHRFKAPNTRDEFSIAA